MSWLQIGTTLAAGFFAMCMADCLHRDEKWGALFWLSVLVLWLRLAVPE